MNTGAAEVLTYYAGRGAFRSFTARAPRGRRLAFCMQWHKGRNFDIVADEKSGTVRVDVVLPHVPPRSAMDRSYRQFLEAFQDGSLPPHRSIDRKKAAIKCENRRSNLSVTLQVLDEDYGYATDKLLAVIHETYLLFLQLGDYADYTVQHLGGNPDWGK